MQQLPWRRKTVNLASRLRRREVCGAPSGAVVAHNRRLYECFMPTEMVCRIEPPDCHVCKYTPSGEYLVCFGNMQHDLLVYRHTGLHFSTGADEDETWVPPEALAFSSFFQPVYQKMLAHGTEVLCKDFCLVAQREQFLIVASSTPPISNSEGTSEMQSSVQGVPMVASIKFLLVSMRDGEVLDNYTIHDDFVHLAHNAGAYLYQNRLAILAIRSQTVHVVQVLPSGKLLLVQKVGQHCREDDELVLDLALDAQQRWRRPTQDSGLGEDRGRLESHASAGPGPSSLAASRGLEPRLIEGFKQRLLAFLFKMRQSERPASDALKRFYYYFEEYARLVIWKVQFLDADHLLLSLGAADAAVARNNDASQQVTFLVVYDMRAARVVAFHDNRSSELMHLYLDFAPAFHAGCLDMPWERFITPCPASLHAGGPTHRAHTQHWSQAQVIKRVLGAIPATSQVLSASPYLDGMLFQYDEKLISPMIRPRPFAEQPIKIAARSAPDRLRFRIYPSHIEVQSQTGRPVKHLVSYHFHPFQPFILCVLQTFVQPAQISIYLRL
ncbi:hypothetical protein WJX72_001277 [[Myrmecia] bisecta]|uniref:Uncharacterized protein n=1 Tax=[Myrmecia] bisecta TaxID=41462 RepID=A0AAW1R4J4_9CHLO